MKSLLISLCFFGIAGYLVALLIGKLGDGGIKDYVRQLMDPSQARFENFDSSISPVDNTDEELDFLQKENPYPVKLRIKNMEGETLNIRLTGRSETNIAFTREGDGGRFIYAINDLDSASRKKIRNFPVLGITKSETFLNKGLTLDEVHAEQLRLRVTRLSELMQELLAEASISNSDVEKRTLRRDYEKYRAERLKILKDLN
jgi:hypothetical protein